MSCRVLVINPGSTSTKIAVFDDHTELFNKTIRHSPQEIEQFKKIIDQYDYRSNIITKALQGEGIKIESLDAVIGRGGLLKPITGGVWGVNKKMLDELKAAERGEHASNLGAIIAYSITEKNSIPSLIADPVVVDEMSAVARISGHPEFFRLSIFHALNQKAVVRRAASELEKEHDKTRFIVAHMGGGISVGTHIDGKVVDVNNALNGEGPFSPERSGTLPAGQLVELCFSGKYTKDEMLKKLTGLGGLRAYLGTSDAREIVKMIKDGDKKAELFYRALAYQVAKEIGAAATVLQGKLDGIILTGGLAYDDILMGMIKEKIQFLGRVLLYPGENEIEAMRDAALRVLQGKEKVLEY